MATKLSLDVTAHTVSTEYALLPDMEYTFTLSGDGTWQVWDGAAWKDYVESTGTSQAFIGYPPPSGRVQLAVSSGTVNAGFRMIYPEGKTRLGNNR